MTIFRSTHFKLSVLDSLTEVLKTLFSPRELESQMESPRLVLEACPSNGLNQVKSLFKFIFKWFLFEDLFWIRCYS